MRPQVSRPVRYAVLALVGALGAGLLWLGVVRFQAEKRAAAAAAVPAPDRPASGAAPAEQLKAEQPKAEKPMVEQPKVEVLVHVTGAVANAGVFRLEQGARVADAIAAAGGAAPGAMPDLLNLAARLQDGDKVYVPTVQEAKEAPAQALAPAKASSAPAAVRPVSINTASAAELDQVPSLTPAVANAIVAYRIQNGPFRRLEELTSVRGIGEKTLEKLRPHLTL